MAILINNPIFDRRVAIAAANETKPTQKGPLVRFAMEAVLDIAEKKGVTVSEVVKELRRKHSSA